MALGGKVAVHFVINRDGNVEAPHPTCTSMPDPVVVECIVGMFGKFTFPQPENGVVTVTYPMVFAPGD